MQSLIVTNTPSPKIMKNELIFTCLRCGKCCKDLVQEDKGVIRSLTILPEEKEKFPTSLVEPFVGIGRRPHEKGFTIVTFQLTESCCPHLKDNLCQIYTERPSSCRQYPFSIRQLPSGKKQLGIDYNCPATQNLVKSNSEVKFSFKEIVHAEKILHIEIQTQVQPRKVWYYDLSTKKWIRHDRL